MANCINVILSTYVYCIIGLIKMSSIKKLVYENQTKTAQFSSPLYLESGRILEPYEITYETYGELNEDKSNVILVCHALSGSHHAAGIYEGERKAGWWDGLIGDGKAIDTT